MLPANLIPPDSGLGQVVAVASQTLSPAWVWASSVLILIILVVALVGFARVMGYGPFVGLIGALYIAYALYAAFPYSDYLPTAPAWTALGARVALYLAFFVAGYVILRKVAASDFVRIGSIGLIIIAFLTAGFIMALIYQSFPVRTVYHFSAPLDALFAAKEWFFAWFVAPLVGLFFLAR